MSLAADVAPLPRNVQTANILKSDGLCLPAKAAHPELAWKLMEFAASAEGQTLLANAGITAGDVQRGQTEFLSLDRENYESYIQQRVQGKAA